MAEFKFTCPQCKQHIQCDISYIGSPINCPACRQSIIVPPSSQSPVAPAGRVSKVKLSALRNILIAGLGALLAAGIIAIILYNVGKPMRTIWTEWSILDGDEADWSFVNGKIHGHSVDGEGILASEQEYGDVTFSATVSSTNREASLAIRMQDAGNGYIITFAPAGTSCPWNPTGFIAVVKKTSGGETTLIAYRKRYLSSIGQTAKIIVIARGPSLEVQLNGKKILHTTDSTFSTGRIGLRIFGDPNHPCDATFSKVTFH
jgi:DNA-directed RNA polymerase subunit RPC12/RpoP